MFVCVWYSKTSGYYSSKRVFTLLWLCLVCFLAACVRCTEEPLAIFPYIDTIFTLLSNLSLPQDFYHTLGLSRDADEAAIKKAYRDLSKKWHPDKHKGDKEAEAKFKDINEAYEVLGNKQRRAQYDQFGSTGGPGGQGFDFSGFQSGEFSGLGDIFESFFGGGGGFSQRRQADQRGGDMQVRIQVDFMESVSGTKKTMKLDRLIACDACGGSGAEKDAKTVTCRECGGTGQITRTAQSFFGTIQQSVLCSSCQGAGTVPDKKCTSCQGEGRRKASKEVTVEIPAGIHDGQTIRVSGQGEAGRQGAPAGDLYVIIQVKADPRFHRQGDDIQSEATISVPDAILGTTITVETVQGETTLKVPEGTQSGQVLRLKGKGMPILNSSRHGDHYVTVAVSIPKKLSRAEKKLIEEWKNL